MFTKLLARQLAKPYINMRFCNSRISRELHQSIGRILNRPLPTEESRRQDVRNQIPKPCSVNGKIIKIRIWCNKCKSHYYPPYF
nr:unnamed protein product [Callosobruchus chinensis]